MKGSWLVLCEELLSIEIQLQFGLCSYLCLFISCERCPVVSFRVVYYAEHNPVVTILSYPILQWSEIEGLCSFSAVLTCHHLLGCYISSLQDFSFNDSYGRGPLPAING